MGNVIGIKRDKPLVDKTLDEFVEQDRVALYGAAKIRTLKKSDNVLAGVDQSHSFFYVADGSLQVYGVMNVPFGTALVFGRGSIVSPIVPAAGVQFWIQTLEPTVVLEIAPSAMANLPDRLQKWVYSTALKSYDHSTRFMRNKSRDLDRRNRLLSDVLVAEARRKADLTGALIGRFVQHIPKLPNFATDLTTRLLDENACVQEIADSIKEDPALAGIVLRKVNSEERGLAKGVESFYQACMILGFIFVYRLLLEEGVRNSVRRTPDARRIQEHSHLISCLCYEIARVSEGVMPQTVTTIGLMHEVGQMVIDMFVETHPEALAFLPVLDKARAGADLMRFWGLPGRLCRTTEVQDWAHFAPPDVIDESCRKEVAVLYLAHVFEAALMNRPLPESQKAHFDDFCEILRISPTRAWEVYRTKVLPGLLNSKHRLPADVRQSLEEQTT